MGSFITLAAADGFACPAYVAQPAGTPKGAIVVVQEIFGVNTHIRAVADGYAAAGYLAVAPATFARIGKGEVQLGYNEADMNEGFGYKTAVEALPAPGVMADLQAAVDHAAKASGGKVGIVGYCWGGLLTWRAASLLQGLSPTRLEQSHSQAAHERYDANTQQAIDAGVFGAPSYVIDGEIFWGQDRLDFVERKLARG